MARVDSLRQTSLWVEEALDEDVGMGGVCGFQGLSLSDAAVADKQGRLVKGRFAEEVAAAPATDEIRSKAEAGCFKGEKHGDPVAVAGDAVEDAPVEGKMLTELPMDEVLFILAQKPRSTIIPEDKETLLQFYPPEMIDRIMETERQAAEASAALQKDFFAFRDWVRDEMQKNGVVKVDDEFLARREQTCQWLREEFDDLFNRLENEVSDSDIGNYSDMYATDDEE